MESAKPNEKKRYLKGFWWVVLIFSFSEVLISDSFIGLKEGFDWSFIDQPKSYFKLLFYIICWTVGYYLLFLKPNRERQALKNRSLESKDELDDSSKRN